MAFELECRKTCSTCGQRSRNDTCEECYPYVRILEERARRARMLAESVVENPYALIARMRGREN